MIQPAPHPEPSHYAGTPFEDEAVRREYEQYLKEREETHVQNH